MYKKTILKIAIVAMSLISLASCKKDDDDVAKPINPDDSELITTVKVIVSPVSSPTSIYEYFFRDLDGDGGNAPTIDTIRLNSNTDYNIQLLLLDETKNPVDTISNEIEEEKNSHQFFYSKIGTYDLTTTYLDFDDNGVPLGLHISINTGTAFTVKTNVYNVVLKHQPGIKPTIGDGNMLLGETDIDIAFPIVVQ